ncbi:MAG: FAD-dependent oxidoreductase [Chloroflexota bacterium]|nr:FAD-dependent oxidoreductase [Chloroflexota bacterium]
MNVDRSAQEDGRRADLLVVGAGVMGSWTAYLAQRAGDRSVTLLDAWGPGHLRASSGDETRITRAAHGAEALYTRWARLALEHWKQFEQEHGVELFVPAGLLWFAHHESSFESASAAVLEAEGIPFEMLRPDELRHRWPAIGTDDGLRFALYEPEAGVLMARRGCQEVTRAFREAGGAFDLAAVRPARVEGGRLLSVKDGSGASWSAESFVFACGPWLPRIFPEVLGAVIRITKQDLVFMGPPAGDERFTAAAMPAWADYDAAYYGVPGIDDRGFKLAPDRYGPIFDPTNGERVIDPDSVRLARAYLRHRFPDLAHAPVVETRVCQYESTIDANFVIARHPDLENVWLVGGGSGHGYKHGPRIGEYVLARLNGAAEGDQDGPGEGRFRLGTRQPGSAARTGGDDMARTWDLF